MFLKIGKNKKMFGNMKFDKNKKKLAELDVVMYVKNI